MALWKDLTPQSSLPHIPPLGSGRHKSCGRLRHQTAHLPPRMRWVIFPATALLHTGSVKTAENTNEYHARSLLCHTVSCCLCSRPLPPSSRLPVRPSVRPPVGLPFVVVVASPCDGHATYVATQRTNHKEQRCNSIAVFSVHEYGD